LLERMNTVRAALLKEHQKHLMQQPEAIFEDDITLIVFGMTEEGFEATAVEVSGANLNNISCLFGDFKVVATVSYQDADPVSLMELCAEELEATVDTLAPEIDGPTGIIFCGNVEEQKKMAIKWDKVKTDEWKNVPVFFSDPDCVAKGAAVLGAVSHGRLTTIVSGGGKKPRAELALRVQNVAPVAVAIRYNYHGGASNKWTDAKVLFDFDRQIPAAYTIDCNAAECVVYRNGKAEGRSEEDFLKETKKHEGAKGIPMREKAALNYQIQVLQKWTRDGEWKKVGNPIKPLVMEGEDDNGKPIEEACESVSLELRLGVTGVITTELIGER